jgi:hypothetical protein
VRTFHSPTCTAANTSAGSSTIYISPRILRQLGHAYLARADAAEVNDPWLTARRELTDEGIDRLVEIALAGSQPTVGLFLRYRKVAP